MTISEAKMILDVQGDDSEEIRDQYEAAVFQLMQVFLKDPVIPSLVISRMEKLGVLGDAYQLLVKRNPKAILPIVPIPSLNEISNWIDFFHTYERNKAVIRTTLASSLEPEEWKQGLEVLLQNEKSYSDKLLSCTRAIPMNANVKISEPVAIVEILKECENLMNRGMISESLESLDKISDNNVTFNLSKEVNRLRKIVKNG